MKKIHLTLILIAALWNILPAGSLFRPLFDLVGEDLGSGGVIATSDPDIDPIMINTPPPR
ncbi:MAG: hypothetical protein ACJ76J_30185 [Thermoanaerobaculia bacterium]